MDDGNLELSATWDDRSGEVADIGEVFQYIRRHPAAGVADHHCVAELKLQECRRVGSGVQARDHVDLVSRHDACRPVGTSGSKMPVPLEQRFEIGHARLPGSAMCCRYTTLGCGALQEDVG